MSSPAGVLLDLYDTLAWGDWPRLRELLAARLGIPIGELQGAFDRTRPARGIGSFAGADEDMATVLAACDLDPEPELIGELLELERSFLASEVHLYEDAIPVLRALRAQGVRTAVVSNCSRSTRPVVERLGLPAEADALVLSFEVGAAKPNPAIYRVALDRLGVEPGLALFVDDQARFCDGAAALGIPALLIRRDGSLSEPRGEAGHPVIRDLTPLLG